MGAESKYNGILWGCLLNCPRPTRRPTRVKHPVDSADNTAQMTSSFWTKNAEKALYSKGLTLPKRLVRMRSPVRIRAAAPVCCRLFPFGNRRFSLSWKQVSPWTAGLWAPTGGKRSPRRSPGRHCARSAHPPRSGRTSRSPPIAHRTRRGFRPPGTPSR